MTFQPLNSHVEVKPLEQNTVMQSKDITYEEKGVVISIADEVTRVTIGDTVFFDSWLVAKYVDSEGLERYLVPEAAIRAKENNGQVSA